MSDSDRGLPARQGIWPPIMATTARDDLARLRTEREQMFQVAEGWHDRAVKAEAERDALTAKVARVEALCEPADAAKYLTGGFAWMVDPDEIRAALADEATP